MTKPMFCDLLSKCISESMTTDLLRTSFVKTALYPFDASAFDYSKLSVPSENVTNQVSEGGISIEANQSKSNFLDRLEYLIESKFPGRLDEFKRASCRWLANDLFIVWREAGGQPIDDDDDDEHFQLVEVIDSTNVDESLDRISNSNVEEICGPIDAESSQIGEVSQSVSADEMDSFNTTSNSSFTNIFVSHGSAAIDLGIDSIESDSNLSLEIRQMIAAANSDLESSPENTPNLSNENQKKKITTAVLSSDDYINALKRNKKKKDDEMQKKQERKALRLEKEKIKLKKASENIHKLESQLNNHA